MLTVCGLRGRSGFAHGLIFGFGFMLPLMRWLTIIGPEITSEVLRSASDDDEPAGLVDGWIDSNPASARALQTIGDIRSGQTYDLTTLPVAVREMRNLIAQP